VGIENGSKLADEYGEKYRREPDQKIDKTDIAVQENDCNSSNEEQEFKGKPDEEIFFSQDFIYKEIFKDFLQ
jgi:hypothetical protein